MVVFRYAKVVLAITDARGLPAGVSRFSPTQHRHAKAQDVRRLPVGVSRVSPTKHRHTKGQDARR